MSAIARKAAELSRAAEKILRYADEEVSLGIQAEIKVLEYITEAYSQIVAFKIETGDGLNDTIRKQIEQRDDHLARLKSKLAAVENRIEAEDLAEQENELALERVRSQALASLRQSKMYASVADNLARLESEARELDADLNDIMIECDNKLPGYKASPLYQYLRERGHGAPDKPRKGLTRALDDWIAKLCSYEENSANEEMLKALRKAAKTSIQERTNGINQARAWLAEAEDNVLSRKVLAAYTGSSSEDASKAELVRLSDALEKSRETLRQLKREANALHKEIRTYIDKKDPEYQAIEKRMIAALDATDLAAEALKTPSKKDDELPLMMQNLEEVRQKIMEAKAKRDQAQGQYESVKQFERLVRNWQRPNHTFKSSFELEPLLTSYLAGALTQSALERLVLAAQIPDPERPSWSSSHQSSSSSSDSYSFGWGGSGSSSSSSSSSSSDSFSSSSSSGGDSFSTSDSF